jgi:hypothetical protein
VDGRHRGRAVRGAAVGTVAGEGLGRALLHAGLAGRGLMVVVVVRLVIRIISFT